MKLIIACLQLMRPKQWVKNGFVIAPAFFSGNLSPQSFLYVFEGFVVFAMVSSSVYVLNDIMDVDSDRKHEKKRARPIASGNVPISLAYMILAALLLLTSVTSVFLNFPVEAFMILVLYVGINLAYSLGCKQIAILELFMVSSGFILRLVFGAMLINVALSPWIISCTGLVAMMIAVGKRRGDLFRGLDKGNQRRSLKAYSVEYLNLLTTMLATVTFSCYILFCTSEYAQMRFGEEVLLTSPIVLYGIISYMRLMIVDGVGDDPSTLILSNASILLSVLAWIASFAAIIYF